MQNGEKKHRSELLNQTAKVMQNGIHELGVAKGAAVFSK